MLADGGLARALLDQSPFSTVVYAPDSRPLYANPAFERYWNTRLADVPAGYKVLEDEQLIAQGMLPLLQRAFAGEPVTLDVVRYDVAQVTGGGRQRWTQGHFYPILDATGSMLAVVLVHLDLTEQKLEEDDTRFLAEASTLLGSSLEYDITLANVARLAVSSLADYCIIDVLEAGPPPVIRRVATAHTNPARQHLADQVLRFPPPVESDGIVARAIRTGAPQIVTALLDAPHEAAAENRPEHRAVLAALGPRSILCVPMVARGATVGTILLAYAESGRQYTERELGLAIELARRSANAVDNARLLRATTSARVAAEQAAEEARAANRAKAEFLAVMSHELRTPLNAIGGYAELIEMGLRGPVTPEQVLDLARIQRSQRHLLSLINDLLNYAKLEAGRVQYRIEHVTVAELLGSLEALVGPQVAAKGLEYRYAPPVDSIGVSADAEKVRQILLNLLSNAIKFTAPGGMVSVGVVDDGEMVRIAIADTGCGIPEDKLEAIFEPFVQLGRGLTQHNEGTGLGLAISRDLARAMQGELTASSVLGEGSVFELRLPAAR
jgi:signal transduction histidine kinase